MQKDQLITGHQAKTYDLRGTLWSRIKAKHLSLVNPTTGQRVLDVGCGTGKTLWLLSQKCDKSVELRGIEPSEDMLEQARTKLGRRAKIKQGIAQKLPYPDNHFDWVISTQVMHHLPLPEKKKMLSEMHRVLKSSGTVVVSDWGKPTNIIGYFLAFLWRNHAYVKENATMMTVDTFRRAGFKNVHEEPLQFGIVHHIHGTKP
jgi:ubiquinone/menaquinone biosynthesis C-methylase UbiE